MSVGIDRRKEAALQTTQKSDERRLGESGFDVREGRAYRFRRCYALILGRRWNLKQSLPAKIRRKREKILVLHREIQNMRQTVRVVSIIEVDSGVVKWGR
ncbi:MAG TPA: hypothetical protein VGV15_16700 [Terriglobales bacterium]|nr:hypothetical protein [Terriglobales bacterium]